MRSLPVESVFTLLGIHYRYLPSDVAGIRILFSKLSCVQIRDHQVLLRSSYSPADILRQALPKASAASIEVLTHLE